MPNGTLSAAWAWGGLRYRIGTSPTIPANTPDQLTATPLGGQSSTAETTEARSTNVYAAWDQFFSKQASKDGVYVANLSKKSAAARAPGTGTNLVAHQPQPVALASPTVRGGVYAAYCNNTSPCSQVKLWQYGTHFARTLPKSTLPTTVALSPGPDGRLWIAWWSAQNGTVRVVRTNKSGNSFGPVETHSSPKGCQGDGNATLGISGGSQQRLDVVLGCFGVISGNIYKNEAMATQSLVPLQLAATTGTINHKKGGSVTYRVADVGDAVAGATVSVDGKKGTTDKKGQVAFHFGKGAKTGHFKVVASAANYLGASTTLKIS